MVKSNKVKIHPSIQSKTKDKEADKKDITANKIAPSEDSETSTSSPDKLEPSKNTGSVEKEAPSNDSSSQSGNVGEEVLSSEISKNSTPQQDFSKSSKPINLGAFIPQLPSGTIIEERYEIRDVIGSGGFATVYCAHDMTLDREVALKVMTISANDDDFSQRFFQEAKIAAKINHPNVVSIYDFNHIEKTGQPYIAMELLHGHDLSHELKQSGPLSPKRMFTLFRPVIEALGQGHKLGIVHKDLKPENLYLVDPCGEHELMKILDFGVAHQNTNNDDRLTKVGQLLGTTNYLAPEYIRNHLVSPAIDVYQMALIISETLTGVTPVSGDPFAMITCHCTGRLKLSDFLRQGKIGEVFDKALAVDPEQRYPDCNAFGEALDEIESYFESTIPLTGGQMHPEKRDDKIDPKFESTNPPTDDQIQPENQDSVTHPDADNTSVKKKTYLLAILAAVVVVLILVLIISSGKDEQEKTSEELATSEADTSEIEFHFVTTPENAEVKLNSSFSICPQTPCKYTFKKGVLSMPQSVAFSLDGYKTLNKTICLSDEEFQGACDFSFEKTQGQINVTLTKSEPTEVTISIEYSPSHAIVTNRKSENICTSSPCTFQLHKSDAYDNLKISLDGYISAEQHLDFTDILKELTDTNKSIYVLKAELTPELSKPTHPVSASPAATSKQTAEDYCKKAVKAKMQNAICEAVKYYKKAQKIGYPNSNCQRTGEDTLKRHESSCQK